jgi:hypothetical protein
MAMRSKRARERRRSPGSSGRTESPSTAGDIATRTSGPGGIERPSLEEFLIAAQKSLARSTLSAQQSAKSDNEFALGERPVYVIDGLEMEVSAAVSVPTATEEARADRVLLDFTASGDTRSKIRFRVQTRPVELLKGAKLELANLNPLESGPGARLRAWVVNDHGLPVSGHPVLLHFARAGEKRAKRPIQATTDAAGRVDFFIDPLSDSVKIVGDRTQYRVYLRGGGRDRNIDEYFVWATARVESDWTNVAEPSAPRPPYPLKRNDAGTPLELCSEMHRLQIGRGE